MCFATDGKDLMVSGRTLNSRLRKPLPLRQPSVSFSLVLGEVSRAQQGNDLASVYWGSVVPTETPICV